MDKLLTGLRGERRGIRDRRRARLALILGCLLPVLAAAWVFQPVIAGGFLSDDFMLNYLLDHRCEGVRVAWGEVLADFARPWLGIEGSGSYRPLISLQYALDLALGGGAPWVFHLGNLIAHALATLCCALLCALLAQRRQALAALVGGMLFALHPAAVETCAWIAGRVSGTQVLFSLAALVSFAWYRRRDHVSALALAWLFAGLALLSKESAIILALALLAVDLLVRRRSTLGGFLVRHLSFAPLWLGYLLVRWLAVGSLFGEGLEGRGALAPNLAGVLQLGGEKLLAVILPWGEGLAAAGPPQSWLRPQPALFFRAAALALCLWLVLRALRSWRRAAVAGISLAWFAACFAPAWDFSVSIERGGARLVYGAVAVWAVLLTTLFLDAPPAPRDGRERGRLSPALIGVLLALGGTLAANFGVTRKLLGDYGRGWDCSAALQRSIEELGQGADAAHPLAILSAPDRLGGVPVINPNAIFPLGERPYAHRDIPIVGLECLLLEVLHSESFLHDATALRAMREFGASILFWEGERFALRRRDPALEARLPAQVALGGGRLVFPFQEILGLEGIPPLLIEEADLLIEGSCHGGRLRWISPSRDEKLSGKYLQVEFGGGIEARGQTLLQIDLGASLTFAMHDLLLGPIRGFELELDPPLGPDRILGLTLRRRGARLHLDAELAGARLRVGEEDLVLRVPAGLDTALAAAGARARLELVLLGPHAALRVPIGADRRVRFDPVVARDLRRIARLSRQKRFYYYFELRGPTARALGRARSEVDYFVLSD